MIIPATVLLVGSAMLLVEARVRARPWPRSAGWWPRAIALNSAQAGADGAILAYGPIFASTPATAAMFESVARYALCGDAPLLVELGVSANSADGAVRIRLEPLASSDVGDLPLLFEPPCT